MSKFTMAEIAQDQKALLEKMKNPQNEAQCILDLLSIVVKLSHIVADLIVEEKDK